MKREFIETDQFQKAWKNFGFSDEELKDLEDYLLINPDAGFLMQNTGGFRKLRWTLNNKGKSGGVRIIYIDFIYFGKIYLITVYGKSIKESLSSSERNELKELSKALKRQLKKGCE